MSEKAAKEMYEHALKLESDYRQYFTGNYIKAFFQCNAIVIFHAHRLNTNFNFNFSAVIPAGVNITHMSTQIKAAVDEEQNKALWVPINTRNVDRPDLTFDRPDLI